MMLFLISQAMSQSELSQRIGSKQPKHGEASGCARRPEIEAPPIGCQSELQYNFKESKYSGTILELRHFILTHRLASVRFCRFEGSVLWPGLPSVGFHVGTDLPCSNFLSFLIRPRVFSVSLPSLL